eukprot:TRINITY_DN53537_c0_g2_i1.p1 TRINITY_DN53537_c0_g2~~TRINITY_DN53537_c0_g2_i1.p1  ORF type:complete len:539 (+),score=63.37 TRINITY_DN53537_c0_g2_i1:47-1663(+)
MTTTFVVTLILAALYPAAFSKILFVDNTVFTHKSGDLTLQLNPPPPATPVITPTEPWESWAVFAYNTVIQFNETYVRMYYDCITAAPNGRLGKRWLCLAESFDGGLTFHKPNLGIATFKGSTNNNIIYPTSDTHYVGTAPGSVFNDTNPSEPDERRWKFVVDTEVDGVRGIWVFCSADGLKFSACYKKPSMERSDTMNVAWYDNTLGHYVAYVRIDDVYPKEHGPSVSCSGDGLSADLRRIGRCAFSSLSDWGCTITNASTVLTFDKYDPPCLDVYTNAATIYEDLVLFFPSMYKHIDFGTGYSNDGLLDIRFATSRNNGRTASYVPSKTHSNRKPFINLGISNCPQLQQTKRPDSQWCADTDQLQHTSWDSATMYMAVGMVRDNKRGLLRMYHSGSPFTHGSDAGGHTWGLNSGIGVVSIRTDGFSYLNSDYIFNTQQSEMPQFTTVAVTVPAHGTKVVFNMQGGVAGYLLCALLDPTSQKPVPGFSLTDADALRGNWLEQPASWRKGNTSIVQLQNQKISFHVLLTDMKLFSIAFG